MRVGIDLGTTNTVVSYIDENGEWQLLSFKNGRKEDKCLLPSIVAEEDMIPVVGQAAIDRSMVCPRESCRSRKREIGQRRAAMLVGSLHLSPEDISALILKEVYSELSRRFPNESFNAFVTVPAGFNNNARLATRRILMNAGFETDESCLADEPVASAIAYSSQFSGNEYVLVVDIGGGTFDLCLLETNIIGGATTLSRLIPIAVGSDINNGLNLGGDAIDDIIFAKMINEFNIKNGCNLPPDIVEYGTATDEELTAAMAIYSMVLDVKKSLYNGSAARCFRENVYRGNNLDFTLTESEYTTLMAQHSGDKMSITEGFQRCIDNLFKGLDDSIMQRVNKVLVVGGMSREICLNRILKRRFNNVIIVPAPDSLYMVSKGAAICNSNLRNRIDNVSYTSIGILRKNGESISNIINQGQSVKPGTIFTHKFAVTNKNATAVKITLVEYRGEYNKSDYEKGRYAVILDEDIQLTEGMPTMLNLMGIKSKPQVELVCRFTEDKILHIGVKHKKNTHWLDIKLGR